MVVIRPWWSRLAARTLLAAAVVALAAVRAAVALAGLVTTSLGALSAHLEGHRAGAALRVARSAKASDRWRVAFEAAPMGMARVGLDGRVQAVNSSLCNLLGEPQTVLVGQRLSSLVYPDDLDALAGPGHPGRGKAVAKAEVRLVCSGGRLRWCEMASTLVGTAGGRPDHVLVYVVDITRHKRSQAALRDLATRDPLSGLANRRWFELQLAQHLRRCAEDGPRGALLVMDLDNFKAVNDTLGHQGGDRLIIETAVTLRRHLRDHDLVARLGGDEFAVILSEGEPKAAEAVARKLVLAVRDEVFAATEAPAGAGPGPEVTVSVGVATFADFEGAHQRELLQAADAALYAVKHSGRNGYAMAGATDAPHLARRRAPAVAGSSGPPSATAPGPASAPAQRAEGRRARPSEHAPAAMAMSGAHRER